MLDTLAFLAKEMNKRNITWGLGGSLLLHFHQLVDHPNDIDLLVDEKHAIDLIEIIHSLGEPIEAVSKSPFFTTYFAKSKVNTTEIDIMGGFCIQHSEGMYKLLFDEKSITDFVKVDDIDIPMAALEDWYILYQLIPNKQDKVDVLDSYFRKNGIKHPVILERALKQPLPINIKEKVTNLMKKNDQGKTY